MTDREIKTWWAVNMMLPFAPWLLIFGLWFAAIIVGGLWYSAVGLLPRRADAPVPAPNSAIVREVKAAGAGRAAGYELTRWFAERRPFAWKIADECQPLMLRAPAGWMGTEEQATCSSAAMGAAWGPFFPGGKSAR